MSEGVAIVPPSAQTVEFLEGAYRLADSSVEAAAFYDTWAATYDENNADGYASPQRAVKALLAATRWATTKAAMGFNNTVDSESLSLGPTEFQRKLALLDAGCGTGLVGDCLASSPLAEQFTLDGLDISPGMLLVAERKNIYAKLQTADLNLTLPSTSSSYDAVLCVGTLTKGHVGPSVFAEFTRVTKPAGVIVATVHDDIWEAGGYRAEVERLEAEGVVGIVGTEGFGVLKWTEEGGKMVVLRIKT